MKKKKTIQLQIDVKRYELNIIIANNHTYVIIYVKHICLSVRQLNNMLAINNCGFLDVHFTYIHLILNVATHITDEFMLNRLLFSFLVLSSFFLPSFCLRNSRLSAQFNIQCGFFSLFALRFKKDTRNYYFIDTFFDSSMTMIIILNVYKSDHIFFFFLVRLRFILLVIIIIINNSITCFWLNEFIKMK